MKTSKKLVFCFESIQSREKRSFSMYSREKMPQIPIKKVQKRQHLEAKLNLVNKLISSISARKTFLKSLRHSKALLYYVNALERDTLSQTYSLTMVKITCKIPIQTTNLPNFTHPTNKDSIASRSTKNTHP
jgi:hypothetical protein